MRNYLRFPHDVAAAAFNSWTIPALLAAYDWPKDLAGGGVIAIGELGGAWYSYDMTTFFRSIGQPVPAITTIGREIPDPGNADIEVALDIQMAGAAYYLATGKPATIRVYFEPNTNAGFEDAIKQAAADGCDVMSWSWGGPENEWGKPAADVVDQLAAEALKGGMILTAASGDTGYEDGTALTEVDFPASSPHFWACGGTRKTRAAETVWSDSIGATGGGYSQFFARPRWQAGVPDLETGRMVSDAAACADPLTGVQIVANGQPMVIGGTSAVAPLYAGLFAAVGRKLGIVQQRLYNHPTWFSPVTTGNNGKWPGDVCCGLGALHASEIAARLHI